MDVFRGRVMRHPRGQRQKNRHLVIGRYFCDQQ